MQPEHPVPAFTLNPGLLASMMTPAGLPHVTSMPHGMLASPHQPQQLEIFGQLGRGVDRHQPRRAVDDGVADAKLEAERRERRERKARDGEQRDAERRERQSRWENEVDVARLAEENARGSSKAARCETETCRKEASKLRTELRNAKRREATADRDSARRVAKVSADDVDPDEHAEIIANLPPLALPDARGRLPIDEGLLTPALLTWDCARTFAAVLDLNEFSLTDWTNAVKAQGDSVLLIETVRSLLKTVLRDGNVRVEAEDALGAAPMELDELDDDDEEEEAEARRRAEEEDEDIDGDAAHEDVEEEWQDDAAHDDAAAEPSKKRRKRGATTRGEDSFASLRKSALSLDDVEEPPKTAYKKEQRRRRSLEFAELVTPTAWENILARSLRGLVSVATSKHLGWSRLAPHALAAREALLGTHARKPRNFGELPLAQKVAAVTVLATCVLTSSPIEAECARRKTEQEAAARSHKFDKKDERQRSKEITDRLKERALEELRSERFERAEQRAAELLEERADRRASDEHTPAASSAVAAEDDGAASDDGAVEQLATKEPTGNEISRRVDKLRALDDREGRFVVDSSPDAEACSEDEQESAGLRGVRESDLSRNQQLDRRRLRERNQLRREKRDKTRREHAEREKFRRELYPLVARAESAASITKMLKAARQLGLAGDGDEPGACGVKWCVKEYAEACCARARLLKRDADERAALEHERRLASYGVRREPLGVDRLHARYWTFSEGDSPEKEHFLKRVFVQRIVPESEATDALAEAGLLVGAAAGDEEQLTANWHETQAPPTLREASRWSCYGSRAELADLVAALSDSHPDERKLRNTLTHLFALNDEPTSRGSTKSRASEAALLSSRRVSDGGGGVFDPPESTSDSFASKSATQDSVASKSAPASDEWRHSGSEYLGRVVSRNFKKELMHGLVTGWISAEDNEGLALWHIEHCDGDEEDLELHELLQALEDADGAFKAYANLHGRLPARAASSKATANDANGYDAIKRKELLQAGYSEKQLAELLV